VACCSCAMWHGLGEVDHWLAAMWYCGGAHLSGDLCQGGTYMGDVVQ
jgi:hypothetical protein